MQTAKKKSLAGLKLYRDVCGHKFISNYFCNIAEVEQQKQNDRKKNARVQSQQTVNTNKFGSKFSE